MAHFIKHYLILLILCLVTGQVTGQVIPYPPVPDLETSSVYSVTANGENIWTEQFISDMDMQQLPDWFSDDQVRKPQEVHIARFSGSGRVDICIELTVQPELVTVHPLSRGIDPLEEDNRVLFSLPGPDKLMVSVMDLPPLFLFMDPPEKDPPSAGDPGVHYFGPGVHHPGYIELRDNETVYIDAGATVYGGIRANNVSNISVKGAGILDGDFEYNSMVRLENCENIVFEGILIRYGRGWTNTIINSRNVLYEGVKVISFGPSGDGINPLGSEKVRIRDCFLRCTDDCIAIKAPDYASNVEDIVVERNTMIGFAYSDGVTIGFETNAPEVKDIVVRDCDILMARGGSRVNGHSGFSIVCDGPSVISNILFNDIRVEKTEEKLFELIVTNGTLYGDDPPGNISGITLQNIRWFHEGKILLTGLDDQHRIDRVVFKACTVNGKPLTSVSGTVIMKNKFVGEVILE